MQRAARGGLPLTMLRRCRSAIVRSSRRPPSGSWGATRAALVTYVFPVIGLMLGIIFLQETADWRLVAGSLLGPAGSDRSLLALAQAIAT